MKLFLASTSPRRIMILGKLGIPFTQLAPDIDESVVEAELPRDYVYRLAQEKALKAITMLKAQGNFDPESVIVAGDITIDIEGKALAKADTAEEAAAMLRQLSGKTHYLRDAYAVYLGEEIISSGVTTAVVTFKDLSEEMIADYVAKPEWQGKAGAYAFQENGHGLIAKVVGSYFDILGLPIYQVAMALKTLGFEIPASTIEEIWAEDRAELRERLNS